VVRKKKWGRAGGTPWLLNRILSLAGN
jgi:hypothetical protein